MEWDSHGTAQNPYCLARSNTVYSSAGDCSLTIDVLQEVVKMILNVFYRKVVVVKARLNQIGLPLTQCKWLPFSQLPSSKIANYSRIPGEICVVMGDDYGIDTELVRECKGKGLIRSVI
jgi:hypothetical protein